MSAAASGEVGAAEKTVSTAPVEEPMADGCCFLRRLLILPYRPNAREHTLTCRVVLTGIVSIAAAAAPLGSTILMRAYITVPKAALHPIASHFHTSPTIVNLSVALYSQAVAITPLWWSSLAEARGRRPVYLLSFLLFVVFNACCAVSVSMPMFLVFRILTGGAAASVQAVGAATVADVWDLSHRGRAMSAFFLGPMLGPLVAPILGGAISQRWGWRSTQWAMVIYSGVLWLTMLFFLPETSANAVQRAPGPRPPAWRRAADALVLPVKVVPLLRRPAIFTTVYYAGVTFMSYYFLNISIETTFTQPPYNFSTMIVGLMYVPAALGYILAGLLGGRWTDSVRRRKAARRAQAGDGEAEASRPQPQDAIGANAWLAAAVYPAALLWYGWMADKHIYWFVPCLANFFYGAGNMMAFNITTIMLSELVKNRPSTGVALNNLLRNTLACGAAIAAGPLMDAIGNGWLFTAVTVICWASGIALWLLRQNGEAWGRATYVEKK